MAFALRCPDCRQSFKWEPTKPDPRFCPLCEADLGEPPADNVIAIPAFLSAKTKAGDANYRALEASSEVRMHKAAEAAGCDVSEMSALKVTDMRPTTHAGDTAAVPVVNEVTRHMDMVNARGGTMGWQGSNGAEYSGAVQTGPFPNMGAKVRSAIHAANGAVSNRDAIETQQPGYRIRG